MNCIKMYDKAGSVLRVEMVINDPTAFWLFDAGAAGAALLHAFAGVGWQIALLVVLGRRFARVVRQ